MKKSNREINLLDISRTEYRARRSNKITTTNINILLNRVRKAKETELRKKTIFLVTILLSLIIVGVLL